MIEVIEMDQWSQTGNLDEWTYDQMRETIENLKPDHVPKIEGGDAKAIQAMFGGSYAVKEVDPDDRPRKGMVWFIEGEDGEMERYKYNFATR